MLKLGIEHYACTAALVKVGYSAIMTACIFVHVVLNYRRNSLPVSSGRKFSNSIYKAL